MKFRELDESLESAESIIYFGRDEKTGIECGINADGDLFMGDSKSGYNLEDTQKNREYIASDFKSTTGIDISDKIGSIDESLSDDPWNLLTSFHLK